jgi:hypothetical protein
VSDKPAGLLPQVHTTELEICTPRGFVQNPQEEEDEEEEDERKKERRREKNERGERKKERPRFLFLDLCVSTQSRLPCINVTSGSFPTYQATKVFFFKQ